MLENKIDTADILCRLAEARYLSQSDPELIFPLLEEALALYREVGDKMGTAACLRLSGLFALSQGNVAGARLLAEEAWHYSEKRDISKALPYRSTC